MDSLNWGKCAIGAFWKEEGASAVILKILPVGKEDSTELSVDEGDEVEATIEGGEVEAVRYTANKYNLTVGLRTLADRKKPFVDSNGRLTGSGGVILIPEDIEADYACYIENATGKLVDNFTAADGGLLTYTFKALKATSGNMVKWGKLSFTFNDEEAEATNIDELIALATAGKISKIEFTEIETEGQTAPTKKVIFGA